MNTVNILQQSGLTDQEMSAINELAAQVIKKHGATVVESDIWLDIWSDTMPTVIHQIRVKDADINAMREELIELKVEADTPALCSGRYYIGFTEAPDDHP